jgi:hypothetical protein
MATALSILISDTNGCVITKDSGSLPYPVDLGKAPKKSLGIRSALRASD